MAERKIGEIFEYNGEWYQCIRSSDCSKCDLKIIKNCRFKFPCESSRREDCEEIIFKKLEKIEEPPYKSCYFGIVQLYKLPYWNNGMVEPVGCHFTGDGYVLIEIKQNKEDMEEKKIQLKQEDIDYLTRKIRYLVYKTNDYDRATEEIMNLFIPSDTEHSSSEKTGKNLKPFDIEAAKAGKPVCTRDGRKARIICFDFQSIENTPIVAVVQVTDKQEVIANYYEDGQQFVDGISELDLMMLPEKKEGWINIYNADTTFYYVDGRVFETKDEAVKEAKEEVEKEQREKNEYIDTIRVEWEE